MKVNCPYCKKRTFIVPSHPDGECYFYFCDSCKKEFRVIFKLKAFVGKLNKSCPSQLPE